MQLITYYCIIHATCYIRWAIQITKALVFSTQSARLTPGAVKVLTVQAKRPKANHNSSRAVKVIHKNNRTMFLFSLYSEWNFKLKEMVLKIMWQSIKKDISNACTRIWAFMDVMLLYFFLVLGSLLKYLPYE